MDPGYFRDPYNVDVRVYVSPMHATTHVRALGKRLQLEDEKKSRTDEYISAEYVDVSVSQFHNYLRQGDYVSPGVCLTFFLFVCLSVSNFA